MSFTFGLAQIRSYSVVIEGKMIGLDLYFDRGLLERVELNSLPKSLMNFW